MYAQRWRADQPSAVREEHGLIRLLIARELNYVENRLSIVLVFESAETIIFRLFDFTARSPRTLVNAILPSRIAVAA